MSYGRILQREMQVFSKSKLIILCCRGLYFVNVHIYNRD